MEFFKTSLTDHWLGLGAFTALDPGLVSGWATKILQASQCGPKKKKAKMKFFKGRYSMVIQITQAVFCNTMNLGKNKVV